MKKMLKHFLSILLLAAFLVITLSGCHGKGGLSEFVIPDKLDESRTIEITFWAKNDSNKPQADIYKKAIEDGKLCDLLRKVDVKKGDVFFIPAKTVHAIGAGLLICEIQQNSNTTYRVFDYNRRDKDGNLRPLHIEKALEVSSRKRSCDPLPADKGDDILLAECEYFSVRKLTVKNEAVISSDTESFVSLLVTEGTGKLIYSNGEISLSKGDSIFIPAADAEYKIIGQCELIASKVN